MKTWIKVLGCCVLSFSFLFLTFGYAALTDSLTIFGVANIEFNPLFTVTYMIGDEVYLEDYHIDSTIDYTVIGAPNGDSDFKSWVNANGVAITTIPKNNKNDYILYATWLNKYTIYFIDEEGALIYSEEFREGTSKISGEGQAIIDKWLENENQEENINHIYVTWPDYDMKNANSDIIVRPLYDYQGYLNMDPVYEEPDDGVVDYYKVVAIDTLPAEVVVPGDVGGVPVKVIFRITNEDGENDWDNYEKNVTKITISENVERLEWNSLAWTPNLGEVNLPNSLQYMGKNVFSRNDILGNDKKKLTINYNGTMAEWRNVVEHSDSSWAGGLKEGTIIYASDGYFKLEKTGLFGSLSWKEYKY